MGGGSSLGRAVDARRSIVRTGVGRLPSTRELGGGGDLDGRRVMVDIRPRSCEYRHTAPAHRYLVHVELYRLLVTGLYYRYRSRCRYRCRCTGTGLPLYQYRYGARPLAQNLRRANDLPVKPRFSQNLCVQPVLACGRVHGGAPTGVGDRAPQVRWFHSDVAACADPRDDARAPKRHRPRPERAWV